MSFDYRKLLGRIVEKMGSQSNFSKAMGLSERSMSLKLNSRVPFKQSEICKAVSILGIPEEEISAYFFTQKVQEIEYSPHERSEEKATTESSEME